MKTKSIQLQYPIDVHRSLQDIQSDFDEAGITNDKGRSMTMQDVCLYLIDLGIKVYKSQGVEDGPEKNPVVAFDLWHNATRKKIESFQAQARKNIESGKADTYRMLEAIETFKKVFLGNGQFTGLEKDVHNAIIPELMEATGNRIFINNYEVAMGEQEQYNFGEDKIYAKLQNQLSEVLQKMRDRENHLKKLPDDSNFQITEKHEGKDYPVKKPSHTSKPTVEINLIK